MTLPPPIRVLVVDDSAVIRGLLRAAIDSEADMEVVGSVNDGVKAIAAAERLDPDVVVLDLAMPVLDGEEAMKGMRARRHDLPVVVFSGTGIDLAHAGMRVLCLANTEWVDKMAVCPTPSGQRESLVLVVARVRSLAGRGSDAVRPSVRKVEPKKVVRGPSGGRFELLAIGTSTGGPDALSAVFERLPANLPVPIVLVQHMPPKFTKHLAERLTSCSKLEAREGREGDELIPGRALIAPGGFHMVVDEQGGVPRIGINEAEREHSCRPAVDPLFRSVVDVYGGNVLSVILTGMGRDGLAGCEAVRDAGGEVIVQDEATSVVWGMPGEVARAGLANEILPLGEIALACERALCHGPRSARRRAS